jgi:membrane protease YdiL (CAAX protease family)
LPFLLIPSTALVFVLSTRLLNSDWGYILGFIFYWVVWCYLVPFIILGKKGIINLFRGDTSSFLRKKNWYLIALLLGTIFGAIGMYFIPEISEATPLLIWLLALPVAIIAGTGEEILWRGLYIRIFPRQLFWAYFYPTVWFTLQHVSSQLVEYSQDSFIFIAATLPLGLIFGLVAYRTNSIKWNTLAHILLALFALGTPITTSIHNLVS